MSAQPQPRDTLGQFSEKYLAEPVSIDLSSAYPQMSDEDAAGWRVRGVPPGDAMTWHRNGFAPFAADIWRRLRFDDPVEAASWRDSGFGAAQAQAWRAAGFTPATAMPWWDHGFEPEDAVEWVALGGPVPGSDSPDIAADDCDDVAPVDHLDVELEHLSNQDPNRLLPHTATIGIEPENHA